ncbi:CBS domain-containing protein [Halogeometricum pallidum JCM 14848]|uniref:CBS domain-containing protein n=1 Tax=Halogeometricum pallidum JCM 14848 TaxID=1227487 RepID=M0CXJ4_HALPD|nr:hemolysin family protein [Halogeometricum pallidum]ELZ27358.1 CBS domain-containing protein [Halogeometricum pallidum JCM 14848]
MVTVSTIGQLAAGLALLFGNGYFVTVEFAMTRVRQFDESEFQGSRGLERAWEMTERLEIFLSGCQLGITICSVGLGVVAEPALAALLDPALTALGIGGLLGPGSGGHTALAAVIALAIINLLHLTVGEQAPTYLGIERSKQVAKYGAPGLYWWTRIFSPVIRLADWLAKAILSAFGIEMTRSWAEEEREDGEEGTYSRGELMTRMGDTLGNLDVPEDRREEIINAIAIDRIQASDVMVDRDDIISLSTERSVAENIETIQSSPLTRFPLVGESLDDVVGVVYLPSFVRSRDDLESGDADFTDISSPPLTVAPDLPISDLIDEFQETDQELALVVEDGRTIGLVTATDAFEAITGQLEDPLDRSAE